MRVIEQPVHQRDGPQNVAAAPEINCIVPVGGRAEEPVAADLRRTRFLHHLRIARTPATIVLIVFCHLVPIQQIDAALLAGSNEQMRKAARLVWEEQDTPRTKVQIDAVEIALVGRGEIIEQGELSTAHPELEKAVADCGGGHVHCIKRSVPGCDIHIAARVRGQP